MSSSDASSPPASPGARWTPEEEEALVAAVRAGVGLPDIAEQHGRTRGGIEARLLMMVPADADVPEDERLDWIIGKLADPAVDWRGPRRRSPAPAASDSTEVLAIWQEIHHSELSGQRRADFLAHPALDDLVQFPADMLRERGYQVYEAGGRLLLEDWAAECAMPGWKELPLAGDLLRPLAAVGETVRTLVAAALAAIPDQGDRDVLERRLGLQDSVPLTLEAVGAELGVSRERIRQRQERALKLAASAIDADRPRAGYAVLRKRARTRLSEFIGDSTDENLILAIALLSFPGVQPGFAARVITQIAGHS